MKSYRTLAIKELLSQKVTSILILLAVILSTMIGPMSRFSTS